MKNLICIFFFWKFFFTVSAEILFVNPLLLFHAKHNCLINVVIGGSLERQLDFLDTTELNIYTYFKTSSLNLNIAENILKHGNLTLIQGNFRFTITQKSRS